MQASVSAEQVILPVERPAPRGRWWELAKVGTSAVLGGAAVFGVMSLGTDAVSPPAPSRSPEILASASAPSMSAVTAPLLAGLSERPEIEAPLPRPAGVAREAVSVPVVQEPARVQRAPPSGAPRASSGSRKPRAAALDAGTFKAVMASLEPKARQCAKDSEHPEEPVTVKVRVEARGGPVTSVRVWKLPSSHPFARCIDGIVRAAKPPIDDDGLVDAFEFFGKA